MSSRSEYGAAAVPPELRSALVPLLGGCRILLLEDDLIFARQVLDALAKAGAPPVFWAKRGDEALAEARSRQFDLLLLDRETPGMDGLTMLSRLRAMEPSAQNSARSPALMVTMLVQDRQRLEGYLGGADDYVPKPVEPVELLARVLAQLRQRSWRQASAQERTSLANGPFRFDLRLSRLMFREQPTDLISGRSLAIVKELLRNPGDVLTAQMLWDRCWTEMRFQPENWIGTFEKAMSRTRKALEAFEASLPPAASPLIVNIRAQGFFFRDISQICH